MTERRLLIIDDEPDFCAFVREVAERLGFAVTATSDADEFKSSFDGARPDVIVLDVVMPQVDGIELVQWLSKQGCDSRVLVITGYNPHYAMTAAELGEAGGLVIESLTKPIRAADLRAALSAD